MNWFMILVFDLDDTLYSEITYVKSGLAVVASHLSEQYDLAYTECFNELVSLLQREGRGRVFDSYLRSVGLFSTRAVQRCVAVYRGHTPQISLFRETLPVLEYLSEYPHYLVTDGNKDVQKNKVSALGIECYFRRVFITHRFGLINAKPSTYCFEKIRRAEKVNWNNMVYVGDNPHKDFVNLNKVGATTIRVRTGDYGLLLAKPGYDARYTIDNIRDLPEILAHMPRSHELYSGQIADFPASANVEKS